MVWKRVAWKFSVLLIERRKSLISRAGVPVKAFGEAHGLGEARRLLTREPFQAKWTAVTDRAESAHQEINMDPVPRGITGCAFPAVELRAPFEAPLV